MDVPTLRVHFFYVCLILTLCIIGLATARVQSSETLVEYVSFAATLSSLILAVLAIIYSMTSNAGLGGTLTAIQDAASRLSNKVEALSELTKTIEGIPSRLDAIVADTSAVRTKLNESQPNESPSRSAKASAPSTPVNVATFLMRCSHSGVLITYAAALAAKHGKPIDPTTVNAALGDITSDGYVYGYVVATGSAGLFNSTGSPPALKVTSALPDIEAAALAEVANRVKAHPDLMERLKVDRWISGIRSLFGEPEV